MHLLCIWMSAAPSSNSPEKQRGDKTEEPSHEDPELQTCGNSQLRRTALGGWRISRKLQGGKPSLKVLLNWWLAGWVAVYSFLLLLSASFVNLRSLNLLPKHQKMVAGNTEQDFPKNVTDLLKVSMKPHFVAHSPAAAAHVHSWILIWSLVDSARFSGVDALSSIFRCQTSRSAEQKDAV